MTKVTIDREERYTVIKHKDLTADDMAELDQYIQARHIPTRKCLVIESDWPEYEPAWRMIEARVTGAAPRHPEGGDELREECERLRMQLAACGVVALANTPESAAQARQMHPDYMSASCSDVAGAVDREMTLRQQLAERDATIARLEAGTNAYGSR